jgi:large repetitive protein
MGKRLLSVLSAIWLLIAAYGTAQAQNGKFDVRFTLKSMDCINQKAVVTVQVRAKDASSTFLMGDANFRFDYNTTQLRNPQIVVQENFSSQSPASDPNYNAQSKTGSTEGVTKGTMSLNVTYSGSNNGAKRVGVNWMTVACVRFDIISAASCFELEWHTNTQFPITGMSEVKITNSNPFEYSLENVGDGGYYGNLTACPGSTCNPVLGINDINSTLKNMSVGGNVMTNDLGQNLMVSTTPVVGPSNGIMTLLANGNYTYVPNPGFVGVEQVTYRICNSLTSVCSSALLTIRVLDNPPTVAGQNTAPVAQPDVAMTLSGVPVSGSVLGNDFDLDGHVLTVTTTPLAGPANGTLVLNSNGTYTYTPASGFSGRDFFRYAICDNGTPSKCDTASVAIYVMLDLNGTANDRPVAIDDAFGTNQGTAVSGFLSSNDFDPNSHALSYQLINAPARGSVTVSSSGGFTYTPNAGLSGPDRFTYQICDNGTPSLCDTATVYLLVYPTLSRPPTAAVTAIAATEDVPGTEVCFPITDLDANDTHSATLCRPSANGVATVRVNNAITPHQLCVTYTGNLNFSGRDTVCVNLCDNNGSCTEVRIPVNVAPVNDAPSLPNAPISFGQNSTQTRCLAVTDPDLNDTHTVTLCGNPSNGTASVSIVNGQVCVTYTPVSGYTGADQVCVRVCDAANACTNVNIPIVVSALPLPPVIPALSILAQEDSPRTTCVTVSDPNAGDVHTATLCGAPTRGQASVTFDNATKQLCVTYTPVPNFHGTDQLCVRVCDQGNLCSEVIVPITVSPVPDPILVVVNPVVVTGGGGPQSFCMPYTDVDGGSTLTITGCNSPVGGSISSYTNNGQLCFTYTPTLYFSGNDNVCLNVCTQAGRCTQVNVPVTVTGVQYPPTILPLNPTPIPAGQLKTFCLKVNDPNLGDTHIASLCNTPLHGAASVSMNPQTGEVCVSYFPTVGYSGTDMICVRVCDQGNNCATTQINVVVSGNVAPPVIPLTSIVMPEDGGPRQVCVAVTDNDLNDNHTANLCGNPRNGQATMVFNNTTKQLCVTYTPNPFFSGRDTVCVTVCDAVNNCTTTRIPVSVTSLPNPPSINPTVEIPAGIGSRMVCVPVADPDQGDLLSATLCAAPSNGQASVVMNNVTKQVCVSYTPNPGFSGTETLCLRVCDQTGLCSTRSMSFGVTAENLPPVAQNDTYNTLSNITISGSVVSNDTDPNSGQTLTVSVVNNPAHGNLSLNANGTFSYVPSNGYVGPDMFTYRVCDNGTPVLCSVASVSLNVISNPANGTGNTAPVVTTDNTTTTPNTAVTIAVLTNDFDVDGHTLGLPTVVLNPLNGTVIRNLNGTFTYTPNAGFTGTDSFQYQVCDNGTPSRCATATVNVQVALAPTSGFTNNAPVAVNDARVTPLNTAVSGSVASNDSDPNAGQTLTFALVSNPIYGSVTLLPNGTYNYMPATDFVGTDQFVYRACDNGNPSMCSMATVLVTVTRPTNTANLAPLAYDDNAATITGRAVTIAVRSNDVDPNGHPLTLPTRLLSPANGNLVLNADGTFTYTPNTGFVGMDVFSYSVCDNQSPALCASASVTISVQPDYTQGGNNNLANLSPNANDDAALVYRNTTFNGTVAGNDNDPNAGQTLTFTRLTGTNNGTLVFNPNGSYVYTPNAGFTGTDVFTYRACDNGTPQRCDDAVVSILVVQRPNTPPSIQVSLPATANEDGGMRTFCYPITDPDVAQTHTATLCSAPASGTATVAITNGQVCVNYTPNANFFGRDTICFNLCDSQNGCTQVKLPVVVTQSPDAPTVTPPSFVVLENGQNTVCVPIIDLDGPTDTHTINLCGTPQKGAVSGTINNQTHQLCLTYVGAFNKNGNDTICVTICDQYGLCTNVRFPIVITPVNSAPTAIADANLALRDMPITGNVLTNDTDPDGDPLSVTLLSQTLHGTVVLNANGTYVYTPLPGYVGMDSFQYRVCDNSSPALCDIATVNFTIQDVQRPGNNSAPVALPDNVVTQQGNSLIINVRGNDYDPDGGTLSMPTIVSNPTNGTVILNPDGTFTYRPNAGYSGPDSFVYRVCDNGSPAMCTNATVNVTVTQPNIPPGGVTPNRTPVAMPDNMVTTRNTLLNGSVASNDYDLDAGQTLVYSLVNNPVSGTIVFNPNGTFTYTPNNGFVGTDYFSYKVCDNGLPSYCSIATATLSVMAPNPTPTINRAPVANADMPSTQQGVAVVFNVLANDFDPDNNALGVPTLVSNPVNGTVVIASNGLMTYTPNLGFVGVDTYTYRVCDNGTPSLCSTASVVLTVTGNSSGGSNTPINRPPVAVADNASVTVGMALTSSVATNDSDPDAGQLLSYFVVSNPANGTLVLNANGTYTYTPNVGFTGTDEFYYKVCDNGSPLLCAIAKASIQVLAQPIAGVQYPPVANPDVVSTTQSTAIRINVRANDYDPYTGVISNPVRLSNPNSGIVSLNADGTFTYTPNAGFIGVDVFTYQVCDNGVPALCASSSVTINVTPTYVSPIALVNDPPVAIDDAKAGYKNQAINGTVATNDSDPNPGQSHVFTLASGATFGTVLLNPNGTYTYTPINGFVGVDKFTYKVCDNGNPLLCAFATVYLTVQEPPCLTIELRVLLEGPYDPATGLMRTTLNQRGLLPGQTPVGEFGLPTPAGQPFNTAPWSFTGTQSMINYPSTVVDWVFVSLRTDESVSSTTLRVPGLLHNNGTITFVDPCFSITNGSFYVVVEHRNHMGVMTPSRVNIVNSKLSYDFTDAASFELVNPPSFGQKLLSNGKYVMFGGDGRKNTVSNNFDINFNDSLLWKLQSGIFDQNQYGDFNMDADVNFSDSVLWKANNGKYSGVSH